MNWFAIAFIAPLFWAISNHIDKYLIEKYFKEGGVGALIIFSALIGIVLLPVVYIIHPDVFSINLKLASLIAVGGSIYILGLIPYLYAIAEDEASIVSPLFQTIPVFGYILALIFLKENLSLLQIFASLLVILGAVGLTLDINKRKFKKKVFWLMMLASFSVALNGLIFKFVAIQADFWTTIFWEYVGFSIVAIILLVFIEPYKKQFFLVLKSNTLRVLEVNMINELINVAAKAIMNFATLLAPLALVWIINGAQPLFVIIIGIIITIFFPHLGKEDILKKHLIQKIAGVCVIFLGLYLLNIT